MKERRALATGLVVVGVSTLIGNGAAYLLSMVAARKLAPAEFGAFGAMLGILIIVSTLSMAAQALTARRVATAGADRAAIEGQAVRFAAYLAGAVVLLGLVAAVPLAPIFTIPYLALTLGFASVGCAVIGTVALGIAQGREQHLGFSYGFIATGVGRAIVGIACVLIWPTMVGVSVGILAGVIAGSAIAYAVICPRTWGQQVFVHGVGEFAHISHALVVLFTLTNVDVLLARVFLPEVESGEYSVGVLLAKIAFFLPFAIVIVLFPKMSASNSRRTVLLATGLTALVGAVITVVSALLGDLVISILGGARYMDLGAQAWLFALEGSAFALVQVLLYARLASQDRKSVALVWVALLVLVATVVAWQHDSLVQIVSTVAVVSLLLTVAGLSLDVRTSSRSVAGEEAVIPIEAAE